MAFAAPKRGGHRRPKHNSILSAAGSECTASTAGSALLRDLDCESVLSSSSFDIRRTLQPRGLVTGSMQRSPLGLSSSPTTPTVSPSSRQQDKPAAVGHSTAEETGTAPAAKLRPRKSDSAVHQVIAEQAGLLGAALAAAQSLEAVRAALQPLLPNASEPFEALCVAVSFTLQLQQQQQPPCRPDFGSCLRSPWLKSGIFTAAVCTLLAFATLRLADWLLRASGPPPA